MNGTRRMWSRRVLRAGWLIAPIFTFPGKVLGAIRNGFRNVFFDYRGKFTMEKLWTPLFWLAIAAITCGFIGFLIYDMSKYSDHASVADMKEAAAEDECVGKALMEQLSGDRVVTRFNLDQMKNKCEDERATAEQYRALTEQREALGAK